MSNKVPIIREYNAATDRQAVVRVLRSAFAEDFRPFWENATGYGEAVVDLLDAAANLKLVLDNSGPGGGKKAFGQPAPLVPPCGAIFCIAPVTLNRVLGVVSGAATLLWRRLSGAVHMERVAKEFERELLGAYLPLLLRYPLQNPHYEIVLFAMHEGLRGRGYGRLLMDEAVRRMRAHGAQNISLLTDSTMSWKFYENYGFSRTQTHDLGGAYRLALNSKSEQAYIYNLSKNNRTEKTYG